MSELEGKSTEIKRGVEESRARRRKYSKNKGKRFPFEDFEEKSNENWHILKLQVDFSDKINSIRTAEFTFDKTQTEFLQSPARLSFQILSLLSKEKNVDAKSLITSLIEKDWITPSDLKSLSPKRRAGRKKNYVDVKTGKIIGTMKEQIKRICELFNEGMQPEEIRDLICEENEIRTPTEKSKMLSYIYYVLRRAEKSELLTRPYRQK